jgi:hypothetical protein
MAAKTVLSRFMRMALWIGGCLGFALCGICAAQQGGAPVDPLTIRVDGLPNGFAGQRYEFQLLARGGGAPYKWEIKEGKLPAGIDFHSDGVLHGVPTEIGTFDFTVTVRDSSSPGYERQQKLTLVILAGLLLQWGRYPAVNEKRVEGSVLVSNQTDKDFDLTFIAVAVDVNGRATALGYQHFLMKQNTMSMEIPFGENLPPGSYQVNVDAVGESGTSTIFRARLVPKERLAIVGEP